jgi:hypothetical protein
MILLPPSDKHGGLPLIEVLAKRYSVREFTSTPLCYFPIYCGCMVSTGWMAGGTAPSGLNVQGIDIYVTLPSGVYRYDAEQSMCYRWLQPVMCVG